jgi:hypothetical protein
MREGFITVFIYLYFWFVFGYICISSDPMYVCFHTIAVFTYITDGGSVFEPVPPGEIHNLIHCLNREKRYESGRGK